MTQHGRDSQPNIFTNTDNGTALANDRKTINVEGFNDSGDRISLQELKLIITRLHVSKYSIENNKINREVVSCPLTSITNLSNCTVVVDKYANFIVEGSRINDGVFNNKSISDLVRDGVIEMR